MAQAAKSGWLKPVLGISLALNVFFIGLYGGSLFQEKPEKRGTAPKSYLSTLSPERQEEVKAQFSKMRETRRTSRKETRAAWAQVRKAMTADPFDRAALETAMQKVIDTRTGRLEKRYETMIEFVSAMNTEERIAFSDAMSERWRRRMERRRRREAE